MIAYSPELSFAYDYFRDIFIKAEETHSYYTRNAKQGKLAVPRYNSSNYGLNSIYKNCIDDWNEITTVLNKSDKYKKKLENEIADLHLHNIIRNQLKQLITRFI